MRYAFTIAGKELGTPERTDFFPSCFLICSQFFITSSSERVDEVIKHREKEFNNFTSSYNEINEDLILNNLHLKQGEENNRSSILMQRERTHTKSITQIITTDNTADMFYWTEDKLPLNVFKNTAIHEYISLNNK